MTDLRPPFVSSVRRHGRRRGVDRHRPPRGAGDRAGRRPVRRIVGAAGRFRAARRVGRRRRRAGTARRNRPDQSESSRTSTSSSSAPSGPSTGTPACGWFRSPTWPSPPSSRNPPPGPTPPPPAGCPSTRRWRHRWRSTTTRSSTPPSTGPERKLEYTTLATSLAGPDFTLGELQHVYESVWGQPLDRANFRRKVLATQGFVVPTGERRTGKWGGAPGKVYCCRGGWRDGSALDARRGAAVIGELEKRADRAPGGLRLPGGSPERVRPEWTGS